jgi:hypothetical protein
MSENILGDPVNIPRPPRPGEGAVAAPFNPLTESLRERLKTASLGLGLARLQLRSGQDQDADQTLATLQEGLQRWRKSLEQRAGPEAGGPATARPVPKVLNPQELIEELDRELRSALCRD